MRPSSASPAIVTSHVAESREFYQKFFGARLVFDCGWYINVEFAEGLSAQFMEPQGDMPVCQPAGLTYNFRVEDVDAEFANLVALGLMPEEPPEDHPWGDRGFMVTDPSGVGLYIYSDIEPAEEFKSAFLTT